MVSGQGDRDRLHPPSFALTEDGRQTITRIYDRHKEDIEAVMGVLSPTEQAHTYLGSDSRDAWSA